METKNAYLPYCMLRGLCIENNWFTEGSNGQYEKLFNECEAGATVDELTLIIWLCSDADVNTKESIKEKLVQEHNLYTKECQE